MNGETIPRDNAQAARGQTLIEFAFILPIIALILFGIIQYGFIFNAYMTLRHAAHVTGRALSLPAADTSVANARNIAVAAITPMLQSNRLDNPVVTSKTVGGKPAIEVSLTYAQPLIFRFVLPGATSGTLTITASATYRRN
jgi:Flp pilus assembly protein TadG